MLWRGRRQSDNIQDSRGAGGGRGMPGGGGFGRNPIRIPMGGRAGGGGLSTIIILVCCSSRSGPAASIRCKS